jgi:hypothetical protein
MPQQGVGRYGSFGRAERQKRRRECTTPGARSRPPWIGTTDCSCPSRTIKWEPRWRTSIPPYSLSIFLASRDVMGRSPWGKRPHTSASDGARPGCVIFRAFVRLGWWCVGLPQVVRRRGGPRRSEDTGMAGSPDSSVGARLVLGALSPHSRRARLVFDEIDGELEAYLFSHDDADCLHRSVEDEIVRLPIDFTIQLEAEVPRPRAGRRPLDGTV